MESSLAIVTAAQSRNLTTRTRVKAELNITDRASDAVLDAKIAEASSDIELALGFAVPSEAVIETFRHDHHFRHGYGYGWREDGHQSESLLLRRKAISIVTSVTLDDTVLDPSEYYLDADEGSLHRLDTSGYPCNWWFCKAIAIAYTAGYVLPGNPGSNLPPAVEGATVELVQSFWFNRGRDPSLRTSESVGVSRREYWVGTVGDPELLPPSVLRRISSSRRPRAAVA